MPFSFERLPSLPPLLWAALTLMAAYLAGRVLNRFVAGRLATMASGSHGPWDDILVRELRSRIPLWSVLFGLWISLGYWPIPERWEHLASSAISVIGFASVTLALATVATQLVGSYGSRGRGGAQVSALTRNVVRLLVIAAGLLVILNEIGIEIRPMLAALGVGGLAVALALQEPLSNLFAGLFVSMAGQVRIGDQVRLDSGIEGRIVDFNWRSTWLEVPGGSVAVVPNAKLSQAIVTNFNLPTPELAIPVDFTVRYGDDAAMVERAALEVAAAIIRDTPGAAPKFAPVVRFQAFVDLGVRATVVVHAATWSDQGLVRHRLIAALHARFRSEGIELASSLPPQPQPLPPEADTSPAPGGERSPVELEEKR